ncbi:MAG: T9SS type A sorting domain-containing protein, partial [Flavobacteriales bacterium]|nr:T9SS type A sorting domain-containing protein [Flavobacteriales bacterium]
TCTAGCTQSVWLTAIEPGGCTETTPRQQVDAILTANAATTNWTGGAPSTDWFDNLNWDDCVPSCGQHANIPNTGTDPTIKNSEGQAAGGDGTARCSDLTIATLGVLTFAETKSTLEICGDYLQASDGVLTMPEGKISFVGTADQTYTNNNSTVADADLYNVEINNTGATTPTVTIASGGQDMIVNSGGSLALTAGVLVAPTGRQVVVNNDVGGSVTLGSTASWIDGDLNQAMKNGEDYNFPVGNGDSYQLMQLSNIASIDTSDVTVNFGTSTTAGGVPLAESGFSYYGAMDNGGTVVGTGLGGSNIGVWTVTPNGADASIQYDVDLVGRNYTYDATDIQHTVVKRASAGANWALVGTSGAQVINTNVYTSASRTTLTGFSQFAVAKSKAAVLSIELGRFDANCVDKGVELTWSTYTERDNDYFIIEKSKDGNSFIQVCRVEGNGNSSERLDYECIDRSDKNGLYFYRLKQVDFDGKYSYSDLASVNCGHDEWLVDFGVNIYPNPSVEGNQIYLELTGFEGGEILVIVNDILGKQHYSKVVIVENSDYSVTVIDPSNRLAPGTYIITGSTENSIFKKKLVVK